MVVDGWMVGRIDGRIEGWTSLGDLNEIIPSTLQMSFIPNHCTVILLLSL